nr:hypothetical protein [Tanacetum cinerariifolium]
GLEREINELKKKLTTFLRENANLQEELSDAYRIKNQLADLHAEELSKVEQTKEKEKSASQKFDLMQQKIDKLSSVVLKEKKLSATFQTNLENKRLKMKHSNRRTALEEEVKALRKSVNNMRSRQQMGLEIEKHLKKMVHDLKNKKARCNLLVCSEEKMKSDTSDLRSYHSQHRMDIVNLLEEEASQFKSVVDDVKEYMRQIYVNEELKHVSLQTDMSLQENDSRDVHVSPDVGLDTITKSPTSVNFLRWYDPPMCQRYVQIIPGLLRSGNELE